jgi:hypothetical protein
MGRDHGRGGNRLRCLGLACAACRGEWTGGCALVGNGLATVCDRAACAVRICTTIRDGRACAGRVCGKPSSQLAKAACSSNTASTHTAPVCCVSCLLPSPLPATSPALALSLAAGQADMPARGSHLSRIPPWPRATNCRSRQSSPLRQNATFPPPGCARHHPRRLTKSDVFKTRASFPDETLCSVFP